MNEEGNMVRRVSLSSWSKTEILLFAGAIKTKYKKGLAVYCES